MSVRSLFMAGLLLAFAGSASAQETCVPRETPDLGAEQAAPVLFQRCLGEGKCGAVDKTGAWRVAPVHADIFIEQDFIVVPENEDWTQFAFLDADGKQIGRGDYSIAMEDRLPVSEGLLPVVVGDKTGFADRSGKIVVPAEFDDAWEFQDGLAAALKGDTHGYIDKTGKFVVTAPAGFNDLNNFSGDVAVVAKDGKYGLIDKAGKILFEPRFTAISPDGEILTALEGELWGIIDRAGNWVAKPKFHTVGVFSRGLAPARQGDKWGFIDTCGVWKIEPKYDEAVGFDGGPARVQVGGKWGLIDATGAEIYPITATYIGQDAWTDGLISFSPDDSKFGLLDTSGKVALEPKYDTVEPVGGGVLLSYVGEEEKLLNLDGSEIAIAPAP